MEGMSCWYCTIPTPAVIHPAPLQVGCPGIQHCTRELTSVHTKEAPAFTGLNYCIHKKHNSDVMIYCLPSWMAKRSLLMDRPYNTFV